MKRLLSVVILSLSILSLGQAQDASDIVKFDRELIDLGQVKKGNQVTDQFVFTNISDEDVKIDIVSTCECTEAKWSSGVVKPGEKGKIDFTFDSNKKDEVEPVDVDVYFINVNPDTGNPYSIYLQYTFGFSQ